MSQSYLFHTAPPTRSYHLRPPPGTHSRAPPTHLSFLSPTPALRRPLEQHRTKVRKAVIRARARSSIVVLPTGLSASAPRWMHREREVTQRQRQTHRKLKRWMLSMYHAAKAMGSRIEQSMNPEWFHALELERENETTCEVKMQPRSSMLSEDKIAL